MVLASQNSKSTPFPDVNVPPVRVTLCPAVWSRFVNMMPPDATVSAPLAIAHRAREGSLAVMRMVKLAVEMGGT